MIRSFYALIVGIILRGMVIGLNSAVVPLFIKEISPVIHRDTLINISHCVVMVGQSTAFLLGLALPDFEREYGPNY